MNLSTKETTRVASTFTERYRWWFILILLGVGLCIAFFFGRQAYASMRRLIEGAQPVVRPWMTIPRVARQFKIPEDALYRGLDVQPQRPDPRPLDKLAREKGLMPHIFVAQVQRFVDDYHKPPPAPPQPPSPLLFLPLLPPSWKQVLDAL